MCVCENGEVSHNAIYLAMGAPVPQSMIFFKITRRVQDCGLDGSGAVPIIGCKQACIFNVHFKFKFSMVWCGFDHVKMLTFESRIFVFLSSSACCGGRVGLFCDISRVRK